MDIIDWTLDKAKRSYSMADLTLSALPTTPLLLPPPRVEAIRKAIIGRKAEFITPLGFKRRVTYCDFFASGKPLAFIEDCMRDEVMPFYANTHTTTTVTAKRTGALREAARAEILRAVNGLPKPAATPTSAHHGAKDEGIATPTTGSPDQSEASSGDDLASDSGASSIVMDANAAAGLPPVSRPDTHCTVLFTGSGSTAAIQHLLLTLRLHDGAVWPGPRRPVVLTSIMEHHSNLLPWREAHCDVVTIPVVDNGRALDLVALESVLCKATAAGAPLIVGSFSAGSNVTGIPIDVRPIARLLHRYGALACFDYAGVGAYVDVDMQGDAAADPLGYLDAVYLSPHKFMGGPGSPGVLVVRTAILSANKVPARPGGGAVCFVSLAGQEYVHQEIEEREEAGTPAILEAIRCGLAFRTKSRVGADTIHALESRIARAGLDRLTADPCIEVLGDTTGDRVPVFSILIAAPREGMLHHHNFLSAALNDVFGIQSRGGCMCAGPYFEVLKAIPRDRVALMGRLFNHDDAVRGEALRSGDASPSCTCAAAKSAAGGGASDTSSSTGADKAGSSSGVKVPFIDSLRSGFLRFSFNYFSAPHDVEYVLRTVEWMATHGHKLLPLYHVDPAHGKWEPRVSAQEVADLTHRAPLSGSLNTLAVDSADVHAGSLARLTSRQLAAFDEANRLIDPRRLHSWRRDHTDELAAELVRDYGRPEVAAVAHLRWWLHPAEACADILAKRAVQDTGKWFASMGGRLLGRIRRATHDV
ncbi:hypothetical protein H9P43_003510 [Blastocladiella emersonii ATCC 22665]|nr:hypothetical protein H9P43_003510 [Blastocladiella emersonii ATCC 22665]